MSLTNTTRQSPTKLGQRESPPPYKIIFNWDGTPDGYSEYPQSLEQLLDIVYAPIEDTQIRALFWCLGAEEAKWPSETLPVIGEAENCFYGSVKNMRRAEGVRAMFERGEELYAAMVERGHQMGIHVYCSIRMNDNHFWSEAARREPPLNPEEMAKTARPGLTQFRKDHPEWCLSADHAPRWAATSWNMAIPEVREYRLRYITEACRLADWDGVELDWQRHAFHLPENDAYRLHYTLTDLQRMVRRLTDQIAAERGRAFYVAVRVGASMETCRRVGYDVETWMQEGLCDIVATNANSGTDPGVEIETFLEIAKGGEIKLYPGFDSHWESGKGRLIGSRVWLEAWYRGLAKGYFDRGADGVHIFNWHANRYTHHSLLTTIGAPETLKQKDKVYSAVKRHIRARSELRYGAERDDRLYGETPVALYHTLTGDGPKFHIRVHDDVVAEAKAGTLETIGLQIELAHFSPADKVEVTLDGWRLAAPSIRNVAGDDPDNPSDVDEHSWLVWELSPEQVALNFDLIGADWGVHEIQVCLVKQDARIRPPLVVENVEIYVNYYAVK